MVNLDGTAIVFFVTVMVGQSDVQSVAVDSMSPNTVLSGIDVSPDGTQLLVTYWDRIVRRDLPNGSAVSIYLALPTENLLNGFFAGDTFAVRTEEGAGEVLDSTGEVVWRSDDVTAMAVCNSISLMATIGRDGKISVYDLSKSRFPARVQEIGIQMPRGPDHVQGHFFSRHLQFSSEKRELLGCISCQGTACFRLDLAERPRFSWYPGAVDSSIQVNYPFCVFIRGSNGVSVWNLQRNEEQSSWREESNRRILGAWVSASGEELYVLYPKSIVLVIKGEIRHTWNPQSTIAHNCPFAFSKEESLLAIGTLEGEILLFDCENHRFVASLPALHFSREPKVARAVQQSVSSD